MDASGYQITHHNTSAATASRYHPNGTSVWRPEEADEQFHGRPGREEGDDEPDGEHSQVGHFEEVIALVELIARGGHHDRDCGEEGVFGGRFPVHAREHAPKDCRG